MNGGIRGKGPLGCRPYLIRQQGASKLVINLHHQARYIPKPHASKQLEQRVMGTLKHVPAEKKPMVLCINAQADISFRSATHTNPHTHRHKTGNLQGLRQGPGAGIQMSGCRARLWLCLHVRACLSPARSTSATY